MDGELRATLTVTNTGDRRGTEVVQLYAADTATGVTLPAQQLVGFTRVDLEPAASTRIEFTLPISLLAYTGPSGKLIIEARTHRGGRRQQLKRPPVKRNRHHQRTDAGRARRGARVHIGRNTQIL